MKKVFKWIGIVLGSLVGLILVLIAAFYILGSSRLNKTYTFPSDHVVVPNDADSIARGEHLTAMFCTGCHGEDLGGTENWFTDEALGRVDAPNLTSGQGGEGAEFESDEDWVRVLRHGVDPEGKPIFMPAVVGYAHLSNDDLGAIIAYLKTLPAVDHETEERNFTTLAKILVGAGQLGKLPVEAVSHNPNPPAPAAGATVEYGQYLVNVGDCSSCHGNELAGGPHPDPSVTILAPNLTPGGELVEWTEQDFLSFMRTGIEPDGEQMGTEYMPWKEIGLASDDELKAIFMYLQSLPKKEQATK